MNDLTFNPTSYDPRWRRARAFQPESDDDDSWVRRYRDFVTDQKGSDDEEMRLAHSFYINDSLQAGVEGLLTAGAPRSFCAEYYTVSEETVECYERTFYDLSPVVGIGARITVVLRSSPGNTAGYQFKDIALRFGLNVLRWKMGEPVELTEDELDSLYNKVQQGLAMRLQELECTKPTEKSYPSLLKTVETATKFRQALRDAGSNKDEERLVDLLKKNLSTAQEPCFDREQVLASRAVPPKDADDD